MTAAAYGDARRHGRHLHAPPAPYQRLGAQVLAETSIDGEARYFLSWPLRDLTGHSGAVLSSCRQDRIETGY